MIVEGLQPLSTHVDRLQPDAENANRGDVAAIRRSLNAFGQRKPVVVKRSGTDANGAPTGIVIAGNHTLLAALELGWSEVAAVFVDDDAMTARAYALADNQTNRLASWDESQLIEHLRLLADCDVIDMLDLGWSEAELLNLLDEVPDQDAFKAFDESAADDIRTSTCPECGHVFAT